MRLFVEQLADRLLETLLPRESASAVCMPPCSNVPWCCRYTYTRFKWRTCSTTCSCWWGQDC